MRCRLEYTYLSDPMLVGLPPHYVWPVVHYSRSVQPPCLGHSRGGASVVQSEDLGQSRKTDHRRQIALGTEELIVR